MPSATVPPPTLGCYLVTDFINLGKEHEVANITSNDPNCTELFTVKESFLMSFVTKFRCVSGTPTVPELPLEVYNPRGSNTIENADLRGAIFGRVHILQTVANFITAVVRTGVQISRYRPTSNLGSFFCFTRGGILSVWFLIHECINGRPIARRAYLTDSFWMHATNLCAEYRCNVQATSGCLNGTVH